MKIRGRCHPIPIHRRLILDVCRTSLRVPSFPIDRLMQLNRVVEARNAHNAKNENRIGWVAIFLRSYAIVCQEIPELRSLYFCMPWPRLYEHPHTVASITIHRPDDQGVERLIWARISNCETSSLSDIQRQMNDAVHNPLREVFRDGLRLERLPSCIRRLSWWLGMNWKPRQRAKKIGTFSVSTLAGEDVSNYGHPLVVTTSLSYTRCNDKGECMVTLISDHRVLDGMLAARSLKRLEEVMNTIVIRELLTNQPQ
ncbi:MAG: hypothetical protein NTW52_06965 [Planctomycetota bacterium]|nr:hypothetical protein [Planctomycetota bacterium]